MPSTRWNPPPIYKAARRVAPLAYIAVAWPDAVATAAAVILLVLENTALRKTHTAAIILHYAAISLMPPPQALALATALIPLLHWAKKADNETSWVIHTAIFTAAALAKPELLPALAYTITEAAWYITKFAVLKPRAEAPGKLEAVAGASITYKLTITTGAPALARLPDGNELEIQEKAEVEINTKFETAGVYTPEITILYTNPTHTVKFKKTAKHPPIYVTPRYRQALEIGQKTIAGAVEEVTGAREYTPGDPLRRIHWKKTEKLQKPVIKLLEGTAAGELKIAAVLYATTPKNLDRVLEAVATATATALAKTQNVEIYALTRHGTHKIKADRKTYQEAIEKLVALSEPLHIDATPLYDYANTLPKAIPPPADVLIGEKPFIKPLCKPGAACLAI